MIIRNAIKSDFNKIYELVQKAFKTADVSDGNEQNFVLELRKRNTYIPELELIAQENDILVGHIMFTKQPVDLLKGKLNALLVAPLCVDFAYRNKGIAKSLMNYGLLKAKQMGYDSAFLIGNPMYYKKFGFKMTSEYNIKNTTSIPDEYVLAKEIITDSLKNVKGSVDLH